MHNVTLFSTCRRYDTEADSHNAFLIHNHKQKNTVSIQNLLYRRLSATTKLQGNEILQFYETRMHSKEKRPLTWPNASLFISENLSIDKPFPGNVEKNQSTNQFVKI